MQTDKEYTYVLYDLDTPIFHHENFNYVLYNMLSMLSKYLSFLNTNNVRNVPLFKSNLTMKIFLKNNSYYPLVNNDVNYDFSTKDIFVGCKNLPKSSNLRNSKFYNIPVVEQYNEQLLEKLKEQIALINGTQENYSPCDLTTKDNSPQPSYNGEFQNYPTTKKIKQSSTFRSISKKDLENKVLNIPQIKNALTEEEICSQIEILERKQSDAEDQLEQSKIKTDELVQTQSCIDEIKMLERMIKEDEEQKKRLFNSNIQSYMQMKLVPNLVVSELFKDKYDIFELIEENGDFELNGDNDDNIYKIFRYVFDSIYGEGEVDDEYIEYFEKYVRNKENYINYVNTKHK